MKLGNDKFIRNLIRATALGAGAFGAYVFLLRPWHLRWGTTDDEINETLPGDDFVPHPESEAIHAITIDAPVAEVWPWLVQMGQTKGGFYSYTWLENLVGCDMHNADRVVPEWQALRVGDVVWLHPKAPPLPVILVEPYRAIVLGGTSDKEEANGLTLPSVNEGDSWIDEWLSTLTNGPARPNGSDAAAPNISLLRRSKFYAKDFPWQPDT